MQLYDQCLVAQLQGVVFWYTSAGVFGMQARFWCFDFQLVKGKQEARMMS